MTDRRFTTDNTEGYSARDLEDLNAAFSVRIAELRAQGEDTDDKSFCDRVAERVLSAFDAAKGGR